MFNEFGGVDANEPVLLSKLVKHVSKSLNVSGVVQ